MIGIVFVEGKGYNFRARHIVYFLVLIYRKSFTCTDSYGMNSTPNKAIYNVIVISKGQLDFGVRHAIESNI